MLTVTDDAASMIDALLDQSARPAGAGLRIAQRDDHSALAMSLVDEAQPADVVLRDGATAVFLAPVAVERLKEKTLDARSDDRGSAFYLRD